MSDLRTKTNDQMLDRLAELERDVEAAEPQEGQQVLPVAHRLCNLTREVALIHIELARRTATGWRPL